MPLRLPRRTLAVEIAVSLALKAAALTAIALLLFGAGNRPDVDAGTVERVLTGERP